MKEFKEISWGSFWKFAFVAIFLLAAFYLRSVFVILLFSIIISSAFEPIVNWFEKKRLGRITGTIFIYLLSIALVGLLLFFLLPIVYQEFLSAIELIPGISEKILNTIVGSNFAQNINQIILSYGGSILKSSASVLAILLDVVGGVASVVSVLLISFYLLMRKGGITDFLRRILPESIEEQGLRIWQRCKIRLGKWFRTQLLLSCFVGLLSFLALYFLGVKYSLILGILAGIFEIVPIAGPIFAGAVSAAVALTDSVSLAIWVVGIFILIQQIESNVVIPLVMKKSIGINPILVILGILAGGRLGGIVGIILAVPTVLILEEVILEFDRKKSKYLVGDDS